MAGDPATPATQVPPSPQKEIRIGPTPWGGKHTARAVQTSSADLDDLAYGFGLERERERLLEQILDSREELGAVGSVEDAVVADQRERHLIARHDLALVVHGGLLVELAHGENRRLRRVDDRGELFDAEHAQVRHREGASRELRRRDGLVLDLLDDLARVAGNLPERLLV